MAHQVARLNWTKPTVKSVPSSLFKASACSVCALKLLLNTFGNCISDGKSINLSRIKNHLSKPSCFRRVKKIWKSKKGKIKLVGIINGHSIYVYLFIYLFIYFCFGLIENYFIAPSKVRWSYFKWMVMLIWFITNRIYYCNYFVFLVVL